MLSHIPILQRFKIIALRPLNGKITAQFIEFSNNILSVRSISRCQVQFRQHVLRSVRKEQNLCFYFAQYCLLETIISKYFKAINYCYDFPSSCCLITGIFVKVNTMTIVRGIIFIKLDLFGFCNSISIFQIVG